MKTGKLCEGVQTAGKANTFWYCYSRLFIENPWFYPEPKYKRGAAEDEVEVADNLVEADAATEE